MTLAFRYTVTVDSEGRITTKAEEPDTTNQLTRTANTFDIYQSSKELVSDIESHLLADRIARYVGLQLQPKDNSAELRAKILDALSDRGIENPSV